MKRLGSMILVMTTIAPGLFFIGLCTYYLCPEWAALDRAYQSVAKLKATSSPSQTSIAIAAEHRHRINCFAEGMGVLIGSVLVGIGTHGLYVKDGMIDRAAPSKSPSTP